jgi:hypothetical protein
MYKTIEHAIDNIFGDSQLLHEISGAHGRIFGTPVNCAQSIEDPVPCNDEGPLGYWLFVSHAFSKYRCSCTAPAPVTVSRFMRVCVAYTHSSPQMYRMSLPPLVYNRMATYYSQLTRRTQEVVSIKGIDAERNSGKY